MYVDTAVPCTAVLAHQIDVDHNNWTGARNGGPVSQVLKRYGTVQILVFALHRVSNHVKKFVDHLAITAARNWAREGARTRQEAKATYKTMLVNTIGISNARQCARLKFDRIGIMLHGAQPHRGDQPWARDAFHVNMEYEYANNAGPRVYAGRPPRHERDAGG